MDHQNRQKYSRSFKVSFASALALCTVLSFRSVSMASSPVGAKEIRRLDRLVSLSPRKLSPRLDLARALLINGKEGQAKDVLEVAMLDLSLIHI